MNTNFLQPTYHVSSPWIIQNCHEQKHLCRAYDYFHLLLCNINLALASTVMGTAKQNFSLAQYECAPIHLFCSKDCSMKRNFQRILAPYTTNPTQLPNDKFNPGPLGQWKRTNRVTSGECSLLALTQARTTIDKYLRPNISTHKWRHWLTQTEFWKCDVHCACIVCTYIM